MLRRYFINSSNVSIVSLRLYRTKGALGKAKREVEGEENEEKVLKKAEKGLNASRKSLENSAAREILQKASIIAHGSGQHNDIESFLNHARALNPLQKSTVYVGTHYEYTVASSLQSLGFNLTRTGRASDYGIDLLGHWSVPSLPKPIRVLLQCKAHNKGLAPANIRELEGAFPGAPAGWRGGGVMGFLVATYPATKGMRDGLIRSSLPMGFLQVTAGGRVVQFVWNREAAQQGLEGMGVTNRFTPLTDEDGRSGGNGFEQEIALTWNGQTLGREKTNAEAEQPKRKTRVTKGL
jgi:hypothetical protein